MSVLDWFRPPRQMLLVFFVVALASTATLGWLAWELVASDREDARRRHREDLERTANAVTAALDRQLSSLERHLDPAIPFPEQGTHATGVTRVVARDRTLIVEPAGSLTFLPDAGPSETATSRILMIATRLELIDRDLTGALDAYGAFADASDPVMRAVALARIARVQRKQRNWVAALSTYDRLAGLTGIDIEGLPAGLVARVGRLSIFEARGSASEVRAEATELRRDLEQGRLPLSRSQFGFYAAEIERWLGTPPAIDAEGLARSQGLRWVSEQLAQGEPRVGRRLVALDSPPAFASWRAAPTPGVFTAIVMGPRAVELLVADAVPADVIWSLRDPEGGSTLGHTTASPDGVTLTAAATGLPWSLSVAASRAAATESARQTRLVAVLATVVVIAVVGWYFLWRGISREVRVARLQSDFVAAVSHEFRSPLTSLRHIAELLATDRVESEERRRRSYALLVGETERLGHLMEGLLDFKRLQDGQITFQFEDRNALELVRQVVADFERRLEPSGQQIELIGNDGLPAVHVDQEAFGRALWNLLDNAVKYSPKPGRIEVRVASNPATHRVAVTVRDEGPGIPAAEQTLIFDRFVRGADAKAKRIKGTGIGLAMAREIARAHGGDLTVTSRPGAGSAFTIALPEARG